MEVSLYKLLESENNENIHEVLSEFNKKHETLNTPQQLSKENYKKLWRVICCQLEMDHFQKTSLIYFKTLRILSREKEYLNNSVQPNQVSLLLRLSGLHGSEDLQEFDHQTDYDVMIEAQKCLSNMIYNSAIVQKQCCATQHISALVHRLRNFKDPELPLKIKAFDIRILFLLSALCSSLRPTLIQEYHCISYLSDALVNILENNSSEFAAHTPFNRRSFLGSVIKEEYIVVLLDVLKVLYNLATTINRTEPDEEEMTKCIHLLTIIRCLLLTKGPNASTSYDLHSNCANLILLLPPKVYPELLFEMPCQDELNGQNEPQSGDCLDHPVPIEYDGKDMSAIVTLLELLNYRLTETCSSREWLTPILTMFVELTQNVRVIRKFVRLKVLPPLRDVSKRPEEGNSTRNKLCLLMTSPMPEWKYLSSSLLFILCKENVNRLIKYTGYGNAAGLLASRGLMTGGSLKNSGQYSSDSEDSDTEEYDQVKDRVNPVTGCFEGPKPSPLEGMSDEQKEYEAMKLVNALDKMARANVIQPCAIGEDGKPHPVGNVMEFREAVLRQTDPDERPQGNRSDGDGEE